MGNPLELSLSGLWLSNLASSGPMGIIMLAPRWYSMVVLPLGMWKGRGWGKRVDCFNSFPGSKGAFWGPFLARVETLLRGQ
jgi:hypothetical protein